MSEAVSLPLPRDVPAEPRPRPTLALILRLPLGEPQA